jgi:hypothetical protein
VIVDDFHIVAMALTSDTARGANFLFLGMVQIAGHQDVRCEKLESKEFVFLFRFSPYFNDPLWGHECSAQASRAPRIVTTKSGAVDKGPHEPTNSMSYK